MPDAREAEATWKPPSVLLKSSKSDSAAFSSSLARPSLAIGPSLDFGHERRKREGEMV